MSPLLGIYASSNYQRVAPDNGAMFPIAMVNVGSAGASTITFDNIPATYKHLQLRWNVATNRATYSLDNMYITINNDTGANYSWHVVQGDGSSATADGAGNSSYPLGPVLSSSAAPNVFTGGVMDIVNYANTSIYKTLKTLNGFDVNGTVSGYGGYVQLASGSWRNTNAITKISFSKQFGSNFIANSQIALYGIKG